MMTEGKVHQDSTSFILQVMSFCVLAGTGTVLAGNFLKVAHQSGLLRHISLLVMVPPLIGLKGNIEMNFSSRISAIAHHFSTEKGIPLFHLVGSNFILSFVLAVTGGAVVAVCAFILNPQLEIEEALIYFSVAILSSSLAATFIGLIMLFVIFVCTKISFDPDNVAAPLAAALGDFFVLLIMTSVVWSINSVFGSPIPCYFGMVLCAALAFGPALSYLRGHVSGNCLAADFTTLTHSLVPLILSVFLSSASGWILASYVDLLPSLSRLQPPINGVGGNLASILISRMTTRLSNISKPMITEQIVDRINAIGLLSCFHSVREKIRTASESGGEESDNELSEPQMPPSCGSLKFTELAVNQAISESHTSTTRLLMLCLPLHSLLLVVNHVVSLVFHEVSAHQAFSLPLILAYLTAGFLQVFVLLLFARCLVLRLWLGLAGKQRGDCAPTGPGGEWRGAGGLAALDLTAIAVTTGLGDLLGTSILAGLLHFADRS